MLSQKNQALDTWT